MHENTFIISTFFLSDPWYILFLYTQLVRLYCGYMLLYFGKQSKNETQRREYYLGNFPGGPQKYEHE